MNIHEYNFDDFWLRYGRKEFEETDLSSALTRLPSVSKDGPWLAGGSVRRLIASQPQDSDFDFFFKDEAQFEAFCEKIKRLGGKERNASDFNITYHLPACDAKPVDEDTFEGGGPELKVQAIRIDYFENLAAVLQSFDFSICQFGYDGKRLLVGEWSLFDLARKRLVPGKISYGVSSLRRMIKYTRQGFSVCGGGLATMLEQVADDPSIIQSEIEYVD